MNTLTHFQQSLDAELRERATALESQPEQVVRGTRAPRRRTVIALGTAAAAVAVAVAVPLTTGGGAETAFAVTPYPDGTVGIQLFSPKGIAGLQAALRKLHIPAVAIAASKDCRTKVLTDPHSSTDLAKVEAGELGNRGKPPITLIRPSAIPRGETMLLSVQTIYATSGSKEPIMVTIQTQLVDRVPDCVPPTVVVRKGTRPTATASGQPATSQPSSK